MAEELYTSVYEDITLQNARKILQVLQNYVDSDGLDGDEFSAGLEAALSALGYNVNAETFTTVTLSLRKE